MDRTLFDSDTGLQYNRARWYDPKDGRFITEDRTGFSAGDINLSRYVYNHPTNATDPTGLAATATGGFFGQDSWFFGEDSASPTGAALGAAGRSVGNSAASIGLAWKSAYQWSIGSGGASETMDQARGLGPVNQATGGVRTWTQGAVMVAGGAGAGIVAVAGAPWAAAAGNGVLGALPTGGAAGFYWWMGTPAGQAVAGGGIVGRQS